MLGEKILAYTNLNQSSQIFSLVKFLLPKKGNEKLKNKQFLE